MAQFPEGGLDSKGDVEVEVSFYEAVGPH